MNNIELKRAERAKKKKRAQRRRRRILFIIVVVLAAILILAGIISIFKNNAGSDNDAELIVNDVVYPMPPEISYDLLKAIDKKDEVKTCYLTFDDGPTNSITPRILDTLRRYNVKATFFSVGTLIEANPDMARRVYDEGHLLANHSYAHNYSKLYETEESFMSEIEHTYEIIKKVTGVNNYPRVFRFPGGGYNSGSRGAAKQQYKLALEKNNIRYCDWNALSGDAEGGSPTVAQLVERVKKTSAKEDIVVLMHDAAAKSATADSLPEIIEYLMEQGFTFKTLADAPRS